MYSLLESFYLISTDGDSNAIDLSLWFGNGLVGCNAFHNVCCRCCNGHKIDERVLLF